MVMSFGFIPQETLGKDIHLRMENEMVFLKVFPMEIFQSVSIASKMISELTCLIVLRRKNDWSTEKSIRKP